MLTNFFPTADVEDDTGPNIASGARKAPGGLSTAVSAAAAFGLPTRQRPSASQPTAPPGAAIQVTGPQMNVGKPPCRFPKSTPLPTD